LLVPQPKHKFRITSQSKIIYTLSVLVLTMVTLTFGAPISSQYARQAVQAWLRTDAHPLDSRIGQILTSVETYNDTQGLPLYYVVYLQPSGYAIVPADDLIEPIIAFAAQGRYDPSPDNPLGALVNRDLPDRMQRVRKQGGVRVEGALKKASDKWGVLRGIAKTASGVELGISNVSDVRVPPLVESRWWQMTAGGSACYNYFTPTNAAGAADNYPCGCVATAMAQLMRYYQYPVSGVGTASFAISIDGVSATRALRGGDGNGGTYSWSDMTLVPAGGVSDTQRQAIGALTHDAGVSVNMDYTASGSGADTRDAKDAFVNTFGYNNAIKGYNSSDTIGAGLNGMANPNLDSGYPVLFGITGTPGGHAIVCDGYGYNLGTLYHHLNLGWAGTDDAWYNLPTVDTSRGTFSSVYKCIYNVYVTGGGEIISGRVTDNSGVALTNATVTAVQSAGGTYTTNTNARGIYAFPKVPSASQYTLSVVKAGYTFTNRSVSTGTSVDNEAASGNSWAADFSGSPIISSGVCADYDGDGKADPAIYDEATGTWKIKLSSANYYLITTTLNGLGGPGYASVSADYDGDRKADPAVYQELTGRWAIMLSSADYGVVVVLTQTLGGTGYSGMPADYDGDQLADPGVYQRVSGDWRVMLSSANYASIDVLDLLGDTGYMAVAADYDGDMKGDPTIYGESNGLWVFKLSSAGYVSFAMTQTLGGTGYLPVPADYDGDGKVDPAVKSESDNEWIAMLSSAGYTPVHVTLQFE